MAEQTKSVATDYSSSLARAELIGKLKAGAHVHIVGICGTGMAAVASLLKQLNYRVTGSDKAFYPPMGDVVRKIAERVFEGYSADNLNPRPDFVVIGNSLSRGNPEVEAIIDQELPFCSMPEVFQALLIGSHEHCKNSIVIAGTHGKTTTSAAAAWLLESAGFHPGYFIGGVPNDLPGGIRAVDTTLPIEKRCVVLEGDEYDSAFFAKWPKFLSYRPDILVVTSLEFDHADIYESVEQIEAEFNRLVATVPPTGHILVCLEGSRLQRLLTEWTELKTVEGELYGYGKDPSAEYQLVGRRPVSGADGVQQEVRYRLRDREILCRIQLSGEQNALNLLSCAAIGDLLGLSDGQIRKGLESFRGVLRRQQVLAEVNGITVIEDFAHHPTAVATTLQGIKEVYSGRRIIAVFEPRSNTSRRAFFQKDYAESFGSADLVVIKEIADATGYSGVKTEIVPLDVKQIIKEVEARGVTAKSFTEVSEILAFLLETLRSGDVVMMMSNGDFGGLMSSLANALKASPPDRHLPQGGNL